MLKARKNKGYGVNHTKGRGKNIERLHIKPEDLKIKSGVEELDCLAEILGFELTNEPLDSNYVRISYADYDDEKNFAMIYFVNKKGEQIDLQINVKKISE